MTVVDQLTPILVEQYIRGPFAIFSVVELEERREALLLRAQLITYDECEGAESVRDVREQECFFGDVAAWDNPARSAALATAFIVVLTEVLAKITPEQWVRLRPADLVPPDVVTLGNCETQADFEKALRAKKRLGKLLHAAAAR